MGFAAGAEAAGTAAALTGEATTAGAAGASDATARAAGATGVSDTTGFVAAVAGVAGTAVASTGEAAGAAGAATGTRADPMRELMQIVEVSAPAGLVRRSGRACALRTYAAGVSSRPALRADAPVAAALPTGLALGRRRAPSASFGGRPP